MYTQSPDSQQCLHPHHFHHCYPLSYASQQTIRDSRHKEEPLTQIYIFQIIPSHDQTYNHYLLLIYSSKASHANTTKELWCIEIIPLQITVILLAKAINLGATVRILIPLLPYLVEHESTYKINNSRSLRVVMSYGEALAVDKADRYLD